MLLVTARLVPPRGPLNVVATPAILVMDESLRGARPEAAFFCSSPQAATPQAQLGALYGPVEAGLLPRINSEGILYRPRTFSLEARNPAARPRGSLPPA